MLNTHLDSEVQAPIRAIATPLDQLQGIEFAPDFADLLQSFGFNAVLELVDSVSIEKAFREYHSYTLESEYSGEDLQIVFSMYINNKVDGTTNDYQPMAVEFLRNGEKVANENLFIVQWNSALSLIKADLFKNTFPDAEL